MAEGVGQDISEWVHAGQSHAARRLSNFELESSWEKFSNSITGKKIATFQHFFFISESASSCTTLHLAIELL